MLSEVFGKITFSNEVKDMLSACEAELNVRYIPGAEKPVIEVLFKTGKKVCSLEEFKALSGYRRFVNDTMKEVDKATSTEEKIEIISYFIRQATARGLGLPARILEANYTKFNQFGGTLQSIAKHVDVVNGTVDNVWKDYIQLNLVRVTRILYSAQVMCMGPDILDKDYVEGELFNMQIPKWIYNKFLDKNFTSNLKSDCISLLFPKNNYLKSISFSTKELAEESFLTANNVVLAKSGGIIALSRTDFTDILPDVKYSLGDQVDSFLESYQWVLTNPYSVDEILTLRETGKLPPVFREVQPPRRTGTNQRPETEISQLTRQISNVLGRIQATWNGILNFVIPVSNPRMDFWMKLYTSADTWGITPTNTMYNCIRSEANMGPLTSLRDAKSKDILQCIANIVAVVNGIPTGSKSCALISKAFLAIENKQNYLGTEKPEDTIDTAHPMLDMDGLEAQPIKKEEIIFTKKFLGLRETRHSKNKRSGASGVRLHSSVLNELKPLEGKAIYDQVVNWLRTSFKTGERQVLQRIAAERIIGEALKHQETIFGEELDITAFEDLEAYYNEI
jgi:hypothetical protein